jgi:cellulose synthase (UDP-forming)
MPRQTTAATPDARYTSVGRPGLMPADRRAQALALAALSLGLLYLTWRWGWTLDPGSLWIALPLVLAETYGLVMMVLLSFSCWRLADRPLPPPLPGRDVAVLIATLDESEEVLRPTVLGALALRHEPTPVVWVLDDGARPWVRLMCEDLGARYLCRPPPRRNAKAGNINHALEVVEAEFLVTLDADHVPRPELLELTLGYLADPGVAIVQGPQLFYNRGFQHPRDEGDPLHNDQSIFFDVICRGKDRHNAAFWCGCPSVVRREALVSVGGVATETVVEDAHTTLRLHAAGWRTVFQPRVLALGLAPEDIAAYIVQRSRWARGSLQMLRRSPPLFARGLSWRQRLEYSASTLHFLEGPQRLIVLLIPPLVLLTGVTPISAGPLLYATLFFPQFVLLPLTSWAITRGRYRIVDGERYSLVRMEGYLRALRALVRGGGARFSVTPKGARAEEASVARALRLPILLAVVTAAALAYQVAAQILLLPGALSPGAYAVTVVWALANIAIVGGVFAWARGVRHRRRSHRFPVALEAAYAADARQRPTLSARIEDLSQTGAGVRVVEPAEIGSRMRLVLLLDDGPVDVVGTVAGVRPLSDGWRLGVDFEALPPGVGDAIGRWCFLHPFGPGAEVRIADVGRPRRAPMEQPATIALAEVAATLARDSGEASTG